MGRLTPWREGVATERGDSLWWLGVYLVLATLMTWFEDTRSVWVVAATWTAALALGAAWQVLDRRDLADRLLFISVMVAVVAIVMWLASDGGANQMRQDSTRLMLVLPTVAGLVLAEQWLRRRRRRARQPEPVSAAN